MNAIIVASSQDFARILERRNNSAIGRVLFGGKQNLFRRAGMLELADRHGLGPCAFLKRAGSTPVPGTT